MCHGQKDFSILINPFKEDNPIVQLTCTSNYILKNAVMRNIGNFSGHKYLNGNEEIYENNM